MHGIGIPPPNKPATVRMFQFLTGPDDADRDLTAIGDQNFFKHGLSAKADRVQATQCRSFNSDEL